MTITEQMAANKAHIVPKYKAKKFIPYLQNFSNTYTTPEQLAAWVAEAGAPEDVVAVYIATRPDCVSDEHLAAIKAQADKYGIDICVELGLQSTNVHTLTAINRGHTLAELIDAILRIKRYGLQSCVHLILNLPWDDELDVIEDAKILSALGVDQVKLHALYIVKGTAMARDYEAGRIKMISLPEYEDRVIKFLEHLSPDIVLQRIIGRAPAENTLFSNWQTGWWKIRDHIINVMAQEGRYQGRLCDYLNGKAVRKFIGK
jgi:radical SAM protein (TIGR01212 family)